MQMEGKNCKERTKETQNGMHCIPVNALLYISCFELLKLHGMKDITTCQRRVNDVILYGVVHKVGNDVAASECAKDCHF
jgi:hypothetical protein